MGSTFILLSLSSALACVSPRGADESGETGTGEAGGETNAESSPTGGESGDQDGGTMTDSTTDNSTTDNSTTDASTTDASTTDPTTTTTGDASCEDACNMIDECMVDVGFTSDECIEFLCSGGGGADCETAAENLWTCLGELTCDEFALYAEGDPGYPCENEDAAYEQACFGSDTGPGDGDGDWGGDGDAGTWGGDGDAGTDWGGDGDAGTDWGGDGDSGADWGGDGDAGTWGGDGDTGFPGTGGPGTGGPGTGGFP